MDYQYFLHVFLRYTQNNLEYLIENIIHVIINNRTRSVNMMLGVITVNKKKQLFRLQTDILANTFQKPLSKSATIIHLVIRIYHSMSELIF